MELIRTEPCKVTGRRRQICPKRFCCASQQNRFAAFQWLLVIKDGRIGKRFPFLLLKFPASKCMIYEFAVPNLNSSATPVNRSPQAKIAALGAASGASLGKIGTSRGELSPASLTIFAAKCLLHQELPRSLAWCKCRNRFETARDSSPRWHCAPAVQAE
jgi:hypothetical protein